MDRAIGFVLGFDCCLLCYPVYMTLFVDDCKMGKWLENDECKLAYGIICSCDFVSSYVGFLQSYVFAFVVALNQNDN